MNREEALFLAITAAMEAGELLMKFFRSGKYEVRTKTDESPVTEADLGANQIIMSYLAGTSWPVLSEEGKDIPFALRSGWKYFWLVDPLDGTREFISGTGEFTVNIAMMAFNRPAAGVIYAPVTRELYYSIPEGRPFFCLVPAGATRFEQVCDLAEEIKPSVAQGREAFRVLASRSHLNMETLAYIEQLKDKHTALELVSRGSSLKFCMMAAGEADLYPRLGKTMEWDTAAGHAIALAAGCRVLRFNDDRSLQYNKKELMNPWFIVYPPSR